MKNYTFIQFLDNAEIRDEVANRYKEIKAETTPVRGRLKYRRAIWDRLEAEYPNVNLPLVRTMAANYMKDTEQGAAARTCQNFITVLRSSRGSGQRTIARNGVLPLSENGHVTTGHFSPSDFVLDMLNKSGRDWKEGDIFNLGAPALLGPALGCHPKSLVNVFVKETGPVPDAGWKFAVISNNYLDYRFQVVAMPENEGEKRRRAEAEAEKARQVAVLREEAKAATQMLSEILQKLESMG